MSWGTSKVANSGQNDTADVPPAILPCCIADILHCSLAALLLCSLVALLPCCHAAIRSKRDTRHPRRPWRISVLLSVVSPKEPPEKGLGFNS